MRKYEDQCVDCPPELGCLGGSCKYKNVPIDYCDICGDCADYTIEDNDYCKFCADDYITEMFDQLTLSEKANLLNIVIKRCEDKE